MDEEDTHALAYPWTFTYFKKVANKSYEENTYTLGTTSTVRPAAAARATKHLSRARAAPVRDTPGHDRARFRPPMAGGGLLAAVRPSAPARRRAAHCVRLPRLSRGHSANVGGRGQCETPQHARAHHARGRFTARPLALQPAPS